ncbi:family 2 glycosyl transferase [Scytonema sp. HK-05]|uniref:glycosyltransferase family 2 protein n=1 Tax=Scytonema sp. HK-05 TaxID=1137095 RepID=UPI000937C404|nr:glycosyltransferase family 2 protein [Scytonema sp. HK-05]OKH56786.1 family 2 glycosyl transferase [Scytonema sp. HK-05]BAY44965.1 family 2 glycosyl transferase [Scytonema sp. HK-05]
MINKIKGELPLVSVIIPAYNAEAFISRTLQSVISQTYKNIEILVVDDGSRDKTVEIVESFAQKDSRIILLKQPNSGVASARNLAIENSRGEYIAPIDADDIWYPQKLEKQVQCMLQGDISVGLVYAWSVFIDKEDKIIGQYSPHNYLNILSVEGEVFPAMLYTNFIINSSAPLIRRVCFEKIGGYSCKLREQNAQGCEDWDIYLRIAEHYQFRVVPEFLIGYRQLQESMSNGCKTMEKSYKLVMADFQKKHPEIPTYIYDWSASSYYVYLAWKSRASGDYWSTLILLYKAIKLDYSPLLLRPVYQCIIECLFNIAAKPITSFIRSDNHSWLQFQEKFDFPKNRVVVNQLTTVSDIQNQIHQPHKLPWKPHARIMWQRWLKVLQLCRTLSH